MDKEGQKDRLFIQKEGNFELFRKKKVRQKVIKKYNQMLDDDFNNNKVVVSAY